MAGDKTTSRKEYHKTNKVNCSKLLMRCLEQFSVSLEYRQMIEESKFSL